MDPLRSRDDSAYKTDEVVNTSTHLAAACFALLGGVLLVAQAASTGKVTAIIAFTIYSLSLLSLFVFSTLHHGLNARERVSHVMRTFDYLSIFVLIAGTTTPIALLVYHNLFGWSVLAVVWVITAIGITLRAVYKTLPKYVTSTLFIVLGWLPAILVFFGGVSLPLGGLVLLMAGGLIYSAGLVLFALEWPNPIPGKFGFHEIWHIMVVIAALCHYLFMYIYVLPS